MGVPGLRDDDVVEGGVAFSEAGEADFENHCLLGGDGVGEGRCLEVELCGVLIGLKVVVSRDLPGAGIYY